ncbi:unnamed protein product [Arctia plantaginis]|nr:unnamed protein product [Arctia plantaginis]
MTSPTLLIRDLDIAKQVLVKDFEAFSDRATYFSKEGLGENLFHADAETWKFLRHQFSSAFTTTKIKAMYGGLAVCGDNLVDYIEDISMKKPEQDVYKLVFKYSIGTIMSAAFGFNIDTFNNDMRLFEIVDEKFNNTYYNEMDMLIPGFLQKFNLSLFPEETISFCHQIIETGMKQQSSTKSEGKSMMDIILNLNKESEIYDVNQKFVNDKELPTDSSKALKAAQAWVLFTAGYANITLSVTYVMYELARNPDVQEKLREEITTVLDKHNGKLSYEALKEMKYLNMVFDEILRMYPLTNGLIRNVSRDIKLEGANVNINQGTVVAVSPYAIHHDERYYPDPEKFYPERFSPENVRDRHSCAFLPFGVGRRSCLGLQLGKIQFGVCVAKVLFKFRLETSKNTVTTIKFNPNRVLLTPAQDIYVNFVPT